MTTMFTIREGRREDCEQIASMLKELAAYQDLNTDRVLSAERLERDGWGDRPLFSIFAAQHTAKADQIIGYVMYYNNYSSWAGQGVWIESLYVKPEYRGSGAGRALLARVASQALADGCDGGVVWDCYAWNEKAIAFYQGLADEVNQTKPCVFFRLDVKQMQELTQSCGQL